MPWKSTPNRTKTTPRGNFFALKFAPLFLIDFYSVWAPQMRPFGHPFCFYNRSKKWLKITVPQKSPQDHPISPQDGPRSPQEAPRASQESPEKPKKHPKRPQKHQKGFPKTRWKPKRSRIRPQSSKTAPRRKFNQNPHGLTSFLPRCLLRLQASEPPSL